jgi:hypothetical protein
VPKSLRTIAIVIGVLLVLALAWIVVVGPNALLLLSPRT